MHIAHFATMTAASSIMRHHDYSSHHYHSMSDENYSARGGSNNYTLNENWNVTSSDEEINEQIESNKIPTIDELREYHKKLGF